MVEERLEVDDVKVIQKILSGNREDFAILVRRYQNKVMRLCWGLLQDYHWAEDSAQEIFVKIFSMLGSFRGESKFSTWLYQIAFRHCQDQLRKKNRQKESSLERMLEDGGDISDARFFINVDPKEQKDLLHRAFIQLSEEDRVLLLFREMQGLSYFEISEILGCSLDSVKARLRRARAKLLLHLRHFLKMENV